MLLKIKNLKKKKRFVIIISNAFTLNWLSYLIRSLNIQKCKDYFTVVIVDYGNRSEMLEDIIKKCRFDVIAVSLEKVYGSANQRNLGVYLFKKFLNADYILFIDSDVVILDTDFFCKLNNLIEKQKSIIAANHILFNFDGSIQWSCAKFLGPFLIEFKDQKCSKSEFLHGALFLIKYNIVDLIIQKRKYIFPPMFYIGFDDYTLSLMLHNYNIRNFPVLNIGKVIHVGGSSISRVSEKRLYEGMKNLVIGFALTCRAKLLVGVIPEYILFSIIRSMINRKMNIFSILSSLIRGLAQGILYSVLI
ncbi:MAG: glycosyltransferase [Thermofilum sp.]|nr:glycosyltransferase [Thermofilum sp.]